MSALGEYEDRQGETSEEDVVRIESVTERGNESAQDERDEGEVKSVEEHGGLAGYKAGTKEARSRIDPPLVRKDI